MKRDEIDSPNPFLQLLAYLYREPDWEHPDLDFMDRPPVPLYSVASMSRVMPKSRRPRPPYLVVVHSKGSGSNEVAP